jgi:hypothetical protein
MILTITIRCTTKRYGAGSWVSHILTLILRNSPGPGRVATRGRVTLPISAASAATRLPLAATSSMGRASDISLSLNGEQRWEREIDWICRYHCGSREASPRGCSTRKSAATKPITAPNIT